MSLPFESSRRNSSNSSKVTKSDISRQGDETRDVETLDNEALSESPRSRLGTKGLVDG